MTTSRNLSNRGKDFVSVKDFGATGDGSTDDTAAVQAAITYCIANGLDLNVPGLCLLTSSVNINRQVDGAAFDNYFRIYTTNGGGFKVTTAMAMFSTSIAFSTDPVSQLTFFDGITFIGNSGASYVLNGGRFLRLRFDKCNFDKILCCNSTIYTQTVYITNCNIRRIVGTFWKSTDYSYDFKFIGNIVEAVTGNVLDLGAPFGADISGNLLEGITGTAIKYNGANGVQIGGNYFEANQLDIDGTGAVQAHGVFITGNRFSHTSGSSNPLTYSVVWGSAPLNCASIANYHNARMHNFPTAGMDVIVKDSVADSPFNNEPSPLWITSMALNDGALGGSYGGQIRGYGVVAKGGYLGLGIRAAGVYTEAITIDENARPTSHFGLILESATPTVAAGQVGLGVTTATTVGAAGGASAQPATPAGYLRINVGGTFYKVPYHLN